MRNRMVTTFCRCLVAFLVAATLLISTEGCATFEQVGTREVERGEIKEGPVLEELIRYHPPLSLAFPTDEKPVLILKCKKAVDVTVRYRTTLYKERVMRRSVTFYQLNWEDAIDRLDSDNIVIALSGILLMPIYIAMLPISLITGEFHEIEDVEYEKIPGSEINDFRFDNETRVIAASGVRLELENAGIATADDEGIVQFRIHPSAFDRGLKLTYKETGQEYIIRRERRLRTAEYVAPWHDEARLANDLIGTFFALKKISNMLAIGAGPFAIAGAIVIDVATGLVIGYVIDVVATRSETQEYFRWTIVSAKQ